MKHQKPNETKLLIQGAVITRKTIPLGPEHVAQVVITYDGPNQPLPADGVAWPPESDWPAAKMVVRLPGFGTSQTRADLRCEATVCGESLNRNCDNWGQTGFEDSSGVCWRVRSARRAGASLRSVAATLLRETIAELRPVQAHLKARASRIAQREATLLAGMDAREIVAPQA